jgi:hypothetical protein
MNDTAGSYLAARLAPDRPMQHALVLGAVGLALSIAGAVGTWNAGPEFVALHNPLHAGRDELGRSAASVAVRASSQRWTTISTRMLVMRK